MAQQPSPSIPDRRSSSPHRPAEAAAINHNGQQDGCGAAATATINHNERNGGIMRRERPSRACTLRAAARLQAAAAAEASERKPRAPKKERYQEPPPVEEEQGEGTEEEEGPSQQCSGSSSKIVTSLVSSPPPSQLTRWCLRSMWELASVLNFLHVFRPLLNISVEFSAEEFETALIAPNDTLGDIHIPLLKAIPPVTRMALGRKTWVTVLCRKLRDWWHWVADGDIPIVASHGTEIDLYNNTLDPGVRVAILKALCDIRVEQEDIRNYIDDSIKHGVRLPAFRKERIGGDSHGISYWYEDDPIIGHRLYREIRKIEVKKETKRGVHSIPIASYLWETVATNFDEFQEVSEKLFLSKNRTEVSLGKKLKNDMLPEVEKLHKRKERLLKKQHRQALLLDNLLNIERLAPGRSLRDRKPVTYTFDDYDRSINEAIKTTKRKQPSPEPPVNGRRELVSKPESSLNGKWNGPLVDPQSISFSEPSLYSPHYDDADEHNPGLTDRTSRRRQRPQRYSAKEFVDAISENEADFDSDDDIVGEAVYDEEYLEKRKQRRKLSSSSEGDEEYHGEEENGEEEEEEAEDSSPSVSDNNSDESSQRFKNLPGRTRRETKLRLVDELQAGLRRSRRSTRNRINYQQLELSESETESMKQGPKFNVSGHSDGSEHAELSNEGQNSDSNDNGQETKYEDRPGKDDSEMEEVQNLPPKESNSPGQREVESVHKTRFLDLNQLAPGSGFDDGPNSAMKGEDTDDF